MENKTKLITKEIRDKLRGDFPDEAYSVHPTKSYLTTLKAMYITERLNDVFGVGGWTFIHEVVKEAEGQVLIKGKLVFLEYDINITEQYGSHVITGKGVDLADGYKSAITDCISKSASYLEIGIDMFKGKITPGKKTKPKIKPKVKPTITDKQFEAAGKSKNPIDIQKMIDMCIMSDSQKKDLTELIIDLELNNQK